MLYLASDKLTELAGISPFFNRKYIFKSKGPFSISTLSNFAQNHQFPDVLLCHISRKRDSFYQTLFVLPRNSGSPIIATQLVVTVSPKAFSFLDWEVAHHHQDHHPHPHPHFQCYQSHQLEKDKLPLLVPTMTHP